MKIKLSDLIKEKAKFNFSVSNLEGVKLDGNLEISGTAEKIGNEYHVTGLYSAKIKTQCVRCLENIIVELKDKEFNGKFLDERDYELYLESLANNTEITEDDYFKATGNEIDITELVREELLLEVPQYPTCVPECKDDSYLLKYSNDGMDSRWAQLLDINLKN